MTDLEEAREFFSRDKYATETTNIVIDEVGDHYAKCSFDVEPKHLNVANTVMGGAIFTLADFTFAVASNFKQPHTVSISSQIYYLSAAKGKKLISESKLIKDGRSTCTYEINVTDEIGTKVALVTMSGMKLQEKK